MKIKITSGTYGYRPSGGSRVVPVNMGETCDVSPEEAARLASLGVARYVADDEVNTAVDDGGIGAKLPGEQKPYMVTTDGVVIPDTVEIADGHFVAKSLHQMTNPNLAKLAADLGLDVSKCKVKEDYIAALTAVELDFTLPADYDDTTAGEALPELGADPIVE